VVGGARGTASGSKATDRYYAEIPMRTPVL